MSIEQSLLTSIFHGHLATAARMVGIGNYHMAAAELRSALTVLDQLAALTSPTERGHSCPPPATPKGLGNSAQGSSGLATLGNPATKNYNPEGVAPIEI